MLNLTTAPITKQVTQKDILLSQIQNGGVQDDDTDDDEDFGQQCEDHNLMIKGGLIVWPQSSLSGFDTIIFLILFKL